MIDTRALADPRIDDLPHEVVTHGEVASLEEAARARGLDPNQIIKTMVVRRADHDYVFVLVPGDRVISWPKLRCHLGVNRLSMPDAEEALEVTGYPRGTITPLGSTADWPVIADDALTPVCSLGGGSPGVSLTVKREDLIQALRARVADVTRPA